MPSSRTNFFSDQMMITKLLIHSFLVPLVVVSSDSDFTKNLIKGDYNPLRPPDPKPGQTKVDLICGVQIMGFDAFEESLKYFEIQIKVECEWYDGRLDYSFYAEKNLNPFIPRAEQKQFWVPYLMFEQVKEGKMFDDHMRYPWLMMRTKSSETVLWTFYTLKVYCNIELSKYPMDVQHCRLQFRPFQPEEFNITLNPMWGNLSDSEGRQDFQMEVFSFFLSSVRKSMNFKSSRPFLVMDFVFERRILPKLVTLYVPSFLIVAASFVSFWIEPAAVPARVALLITNILSLIQLLLYARKELPPVSSITAMDVWFFFSLIFICAVITEFVFAYQAYLNGRKKKEVNDAKKCDISEREQLIERAQKKIVPVPWNHISEDKLKQARLTNGVYRDNSGTLSRNDFKKYNYSQVSHVVKSTIKEWIRQERMDHISKRVFPVLLLLFTFFYFIAYLH